MLIARIEPFNNLCFRLRLRKALFRLMTGKPCNVAPLQNSLSHLRQPQVRSSFRIFPPQCWILQAHKFSFAEQEILRQLTLHTMKL